MWRTVWCLLLLVACDDGATCSPPPELAYTCEPVTSADNTCVGGPVINGVQVDTDKAFPVGCVAGFPYCEGDTLEIGHMCECVPEASSVPVWGCPL